VPLDDLLNHFNQAQNSTTLFAKVHVNIIILSLWNYIELKPNVISRLSCKMCRPPHISERTLSFPSFYYFSSVTWN